ncbi:MAG: cell division protein ZipA C-terminal FtsZ-binding domain-containing protein [Gammaproteobacteria bacterium]|nr:cell division protein ZipA C-terminal FtsZ-binding domain-containing protein [Gammaproteobacteria bacterium]MDH4255381.1 cell division protein ZipA C-terminal FtsZ-binding domain-containing protein [Gammaproteobacteria bacterium]MDH5261374.1 cell division protein ZipA C-terminal FtsZ-binding domain-containing protein [Gammaproteobacteria bacterium]
MDGLRWILLLSGLMVVAGVYLYSRRERNRPLDKPDRQPRGEPPLAGGKKEPSIADEAGATPGPDEVPDSGAIKKAAPKIVTVRVVSGDKKPFPGDELVLSLRGIGMRHGRFGIFHRYEGNDENKVIFSAASLVEPGSFELENIREQKFPGVSLFMILPGPIDGAEAFDLMIVAARALAKTMNAELLDESGSTLSIQRQRYLREEIIQYQHGFSVS